MSVIVLDASAGVEIAFQTPVGWQLQAKIPAGSTTWLPEHYFVEVTGVLRRAEINGRHTEAQVRVALDRLLGAPVRRVSVRPLISEAWLLRHNMTVADSLYVVMARHLGADLVTTDLKLASSPTLKSQRSHPDRRAGTVLSALWSFCGPSDDGPPRVVAVTGGQRFRRSRPVSRHQPRSAGPPDQNYDI